jgi:hypothetical protein
VTAQLNKLPMDSQAGPDAFMNSPSHCSARCGPISCLESKVAPGSIRRGRLKTYRE